MLLVATLQYVPEQYKDKEIVHNALIENGLALEYVPDEFKNDKYIILLSLYNNPNSLDLISEKIKSNYEKINIPKFKTYFLENRDNLKKEWWDKQK